MKAHFDLIFHSNIILYAHADGRNWGWVHCNFKREGNFLVVLIPCIYVNCYKDFHLLKTKDLWIQQGKEAAKVVAYL